MWGDMGGLLHLPASPTYMLVLPLFTPPVPPLEVSSPTQGPRLSESRIRIMELIAIEKQYQ